MSAVRVMILAAALASAACRETNPLFGAATGVGDAGAPGVGIQAPALTPPARDASPRDAPPGPEAGALRDASASPPDAGPRDLAPSPDASAVAADAAAPSGLALGLVGWWSFEEAKGVAFADDVSGNGNRGAFRDIDPSADRVPGKSGGAIAVRTKGWVRVPDSASLDSITDAVTLAAWARLDPGSGTLPRPVAARQIGTGGAEHYGIFAEQGKVSFFMGERGGLGWVAPMPTGRWVHLAMTYDGRTLRGYVDGVEVGATQMARRPTADATPFTIGGNADDGYDRVTYNWYGAIDEVLLYRRALAAAEVQKLAGKALP